MNLKLLLVAVLLLATSALYSQTLKITAVDASSDAVYNEVANKYLGKNIVLSVYDNSIGIKVGNMTPENLRKSKDGYYVLVVRDSNTEIETHTLTVNSTLSVITSVALEFIIEEKGGRNRRVSATLTAKRF